MVDTCIRLAGCFGYREPNRVALRHILGNHLTLRNRALEQNMIRIALLATVSWLAIFSAVVAQESSSDALAALERKLHGDWRGGPCVGELRFKADGTYERKHYSPANNNSTGTWTLHWDALPPTLTLECKASNDEADINKTFPYELRQLYGGTFTIANENGSKPLVYNRDKNPK